MAGLRSLAVDFFRRSWRLSAALAAFAAIFLTIADRHVESFGTGAIFTGAANVPEADAALVPGTAKYASRGRINAYYLERIRGAAELYRLGKVRGIVVSGDNSKRNYNEPQRMKEDLAELGVPPEFITCDYAGFRTLDSVVRMGEVFGMKRYVIVSQDFHLPRAIYLARAFGQDPVGYIPKSPEPGDGVRVRMREVFARAVAVIDVNLIGRAPKFLGEPIKVRLAGATGAPASKE